jgi:aminoglycoside phosphotransferase (APT) family kinase protein
MDDVRGEWRAHLTTAAATSSISPRLRARWEAWLDDDAFWPAPTTWTHGELYGAHALIDTPARIVGVLDWTTARVADPAVDFVYQHMMGADALDATANAYLAAGGMPLPNLAARCAEISAAAPLLYAAFASQTGEPQHLSAAAALLNPDAT